MKRYKIVKDISQNLILNDIILIASYDDKDIPNMIGVICDMNNTTVDILLLDKIGRIVIQVDKKLTDEYDEKPVIIGKLDDNIVICSKIICDDMQQLRDAYDKFIGHNIKEIVEKQIELYVAKK